MFCICEVIVDVIFSYFDLTDFCKYFFIFLSLSVEEKADVDALICGFLKIVPLMFLL